MQTAFPTLDEVVKCDKSHLRWILAWREPYCISSSREQPVDVAVSSPGTYKKFCCSPNYKTCPFYKASIPRKLLRGERITPPNDA